MSRLFHVGLLLPVEGKVIRGAGILVHGDRVSEIASFKYLKKKYSRVKVVDFSSCVCTPGLINCHAHLELSHLAGKIHWRNDFVDWIMQIVKRKMLWKKEDYLRHIHMGLRQLINTGCTTVADHSTKGYSYGPLKREGLRGICLYEFVHFSGKGLKQLENSLTSFLISQSSRVKKGLAIHAPYSVHPQLIRFAAKLSRQKKSLLSTHICELKEEIDFIQRGSSKNPFRRLLEARNIWNDNWQIPGKNPLDYFHDLGCRNYMGIHVNFTRKKNIPRLKKTLKAVIYCPLSHRYFGHPRWPLRSYLKAGIPVALGTDSLASNRKLDMRAEMACVHENFPWLSAERILKMATINGARALGLSKDIGSIRKNKKADLLFFKATLQEKKALEEIISGKVRLKASLCDGRWLKKP
jgi:cytosine/adenosine deaminase-related metal-dependent hydrolase